jgi:hypothetical protein
MVVMHDVSGSATEVGHLQRTFDGDVDTSSGFTARALGVGGELRIERLLGGDAWYRLGP